jgi:hypothetical protein
MKRHTFAFAAAVACGLGVVATRAAEDAEREGENERTRLGYKSPPEPPKVHKHTREIERRLRQKARLAAKRGEA